LHLKSHKNFIYKKKYIMNLCKIHLGLIHNFIGILRTILKELFKKKDIYYLE